MLNRSSNDPISGTETHSEAWFVDYDLPPNLIAQHAVEPRDSARLMILGPGQGELHHRVVSDLPDWLQPGDLLVFNDTRVIPARLLGQREGTGGAFEMLFVRAVEGGLWEVMAKTGGRPGPGTRFLAKAPLLTQGSSSDTDILSLILEGRTERRRWLVRPEASGDFATLLNRFGHLPLPPYIRDGREEPGDRDRYQTIWAAAPGSVAAPTAGLHFTTDLLARLADKGLESARVTLHVGPGTFQTIQGDPAMHQVESEWGEVSADAAEKIAACKARKGRVVAIGTTTTRVLESAAQSWAKSPTLLPTPWKGEADLTIRPGHTFRAVDLLFTNFHLPRSGLLLLAGAKAGCDRLKNAYNEAISQGYRFYSYGDAMLIFPQILSQG